MKILFLIIGVLVIMRVYATTVIQNTGGLNCSSTCINGVCTNSCSDETPTYVGNGNIITKTIEHSNFDTILASGVSLTIKQNDRYEVEVSADDNLIDQINFTQSKTALTVSLKNGSYSNASINVSITLPMLKKLQQEGSEQISLDGFYQQEVSLISSGAGRIIGKGNKFKQLLFSGQGATTLDMSGSMVDNANINVDGTGDISLSFSNQGGSLSGSIQGVSTVSYCGNPENKLKVFGISDIKKLDC